MKPANILLQRLPNGRINLKVADFGIGGLTSAQEIQQARDLMERLLRVASPLGLYAEEFDSPTGRHLGNFPQAFSHLALIEAAARIIVPELLEGH